MTAARRRTTTALAAVVVGVLAALPLVLAAPPAQASTYRYWTYWWARANTSDKTGWAFASSGPASHPVDDTWVVGWRFSTTTSTTGGAAPRQSADFDTLCPDLPPVKDADRVALVIDYGTLSDAPPGQRPPTTTTARVECVTVPRPSATRHGTGLAVLRATTPPVEIRSKDGLVCALDGYPRGECAPLVADPSPSPTATRTAAPAPSRTSAAPVGPVTGRTTAPPPNGTATVPTTGASAASSSAVAAGSSPQGAASDSPSRPGTGADPSDEPTLQAASGAPAGDTASRAGPGSPVATVLGTAAVVALAAAAFWISRRRS